MLIPRFTIKRMLALVAVAAVISLIFSLALRGSGVVSAIMTGASVALVGTAVTFGVFALAFWLVWVTSLFLAKRDAQHALRAHAAQSAGRRD